MEGARNRRRAHRQDIHVLTNLLQSFFVTYSEPLFLVDDQQADVAKIDVFRQQPVRANHHIDAAQKPVPRRSL